MAEITVDQTGKIEGVFVFDKKSYPGEQAILAAWHRLADFAAADPVLKHASMHKVELYIGGDDGAD